MSEIGGDVSTIVVRVSSDMSREAVKMTNEAIKQLLLHLIQKAKEQADKAGEVALKKLLRSNDEIKMFDIEPKQLKAFAENAKKYEVTFTAIEDQGRHSVLYKQSEESRIKRMIENLIEKELSTKENPGLKKAEDKGDHNGRKTDTPGNPQAERSERGKDQRERKSLDEKREEIKPLVAAQEKQPPVKNKDKDRGGR